MAESEALERLIVALDVKTADEAVELAREIMPAVNFFKVGLSLFCAAGPGIVKTLTDLGASVFLDLKINDIPEQVAKSAEIIGSLDAAMVSVHCLGGPAMMEAAKKGVTAGARQVGARDPMVVGVTVLTSLDDVDLVSLGLTRTVEQEVSVLARLAAEAGLDGVVASGREVDIIRSSAGSDLKIVTPGVRPAGASAADQKRVLTPTKAILAGSDYLVVGRPITGSVNPKAAALAIQEEIKQALM